MHSWLEFVGLLAKCTVETFRVFCVCHWSFHKWLRLFMTLAMSVWQLVCLYFQYSDLKYQSMLTPTFLYWICNTLQPIFDLRIHWFSSLWRLSFQLYLTWTGQICSKLHMTLQSNSETGHKFYVTLQNNSEMAHYLEIFAPATDLADLRPNFYYKEKLLRRGHHGVSFPAIGLRAL